MTVIGVDIQKAADLLNAGELVAIPTETVYGLAGNALNIETVGKIYEAKKRPFFNPLIIHLPSLEAAKPYVRDIPESLQMLAKAFSPGPISFLMPKSELVPDMITAGSDNVVIRIPDHPMTLELLRKLDFPLAAPSANPFGYVSPVTAQHVLDGLHGKIAYILDGGICRVGLESTIVGEEDGQLIVYRLGGITLEQIEKTTGIKPSLSLFHKNPDTPGQLTSHYAPGKPVLVGDVASLLAGKDVARVGVITFQKEHGIKNSYVLSPSGNLAEAAAGLFQALRDLDKADIDYIIAERFPNEGMGMAINDRLSRASA